MVSLTVRPTISRQVGYVQDPNPELKDRRHHQQVPVIQVREMESLLQVRSGQTVILGGLIQDDSNNARDGLPGLSRPEGFGAVFGQHERINSQTELVIFLRPIVVSNPTLESDELRQFQRLLPSSARSSALSLLLKALKQAEAANADKSGAGQPAIEGDLELEPVAAPGTAAGTRMGGAAAPAVWQQRTHPRATRARRLSAGHNSRWCRSPPCWPR